MGAQRSVEERLAEMRARIEALRSAQRRLEARQDAAERKRQERRRYLLGAFVLERLGNDERLLAYVRRELPGWLEGERDRALFAGLLGTGDVGGTGPAAEGATSPSREDEAGETSADVLGSVAGGGPGRAG